jgi:DNA-binding response OmpR family regulator
MIITDLRMESDQAGAEVISAARSAPYQPAIALITAFPLADEDWQEMGADHMLVKPMHTRRLLEQIDQLLESHTRKLARKAPASSPSSLQPKPVAKRPTAKKALAAKKPVKSTKPAAAARKPRVPKSPARLRSKA